MASPPLTVQLPDLLYDNLRVRAEQSRRTVQEELVHVVSLIVPGVPVLPNELRAELDRLDSFTDDQLWTAARSRVAEADSERLADLNFDARERSLTNAERDEQTRLLDETNRVMLVRAKAAVLLKRRGHDISSLAPQR